MSTRFVAEGGTNFDELNGWYIDEDGNKYLKVDEVKWEQLQRMLPYYDHCCKVCHGEDRARGYEGRYVIERIINILTDGYCNR